MGGSTGTAEPQKGDKMALRIVQAGYKTSLYLYAAGIHPETELSYAELLAELTTELELALEGGGEGNVTDSGEGQNYSEDTENREAYSNRKREWEELLEQSVVLEAMLRQMLEYGPEQQKEEQQKQSEHKDKKEPDNEFELTGFPDTSEGKPKNSRQYTDYHGDSEFLQQNAGNGGEYFSPSAAGRQSMLQRLICLTCQIECDRKRQWKIMK